MKKVLLAAIAVLTFGLTLTAHADVFNIYASQTSEYVVRLGEITVIDNYIGGSVVYTVPEFNGTASYNDPGPFPVYLVGSFPVIENTTDISLSGTFGNSVVQSSAGVDLFVGSLSQNFFLFAQCSEFDPCWTGANGVTPYSQDVVGPFSTTPEPSTFLLLGSGLLGMAGSLRRRFIR